MAFPYVQTIQDVTTGAPTGIHFEPGLWMIVPNTKDACKEGVSLVRMASIPHGTTICAQGTSTTLNGAPNIPSVSITPFVTGAPQNPILFPSQTASVRGYSQIPQNLTAGAGGLTEPTWQSMLQNPNIVFRNAISGQRITQTTVISIATNPNAPLFGGGTDNIAFLLGNASALTAPQNPVENAQTLQMSATFWIETVEHTIIVPIFHPGEPPLTLKAESTEPGQVVPTFLVRPPIPIPAPRPITVFSKQIQYSQVVMLNFAGLTWPHVSVATLVPSGISSGPTFGLGCEAKLKRTGGRPSALGMAAPPAVCWQCSRHCVPRCWCSGPGSSGLSERARIGIFLHSRGYDNPVRLNARCLSAHRHPTGIFQPLLPRVEEGFGLGAFHWPRHSRPDGAGSRQARRSR